MGDCEQLVYGCNLGAWGNLCMCAIWVTVGNLCMCAIWVTVGNLCMGVILGARVNLCAKISHLLRTAPSVCVEIPHLERKGVIS